MGNNMSKTEVDHFIDSLQTPSVLSHFHRIMPASWWDGMGFMISRLCVECIREGYRYNNDNAGLLYDAFKTNMQRGVRSMDYEFTDYVREHFNKDSVYACNSFELGSIGAIEAGLCLWDSSYIHAYTRFCSVSSIEKDLPHIIINDYRFIEQIITGTKFERRILYKRWGIV